MIVEIKTLKNIFDQDEHYLIILNEKTGEKYVEQKAATVANRIKNVIDGKLDKATDSQPKTK